MRRTWSGTLLATAPLCLGAVEGLANDRCPDSRAEIATDRPDVTNSSLVIPRGSLQVESGLNWTVRQDSSALDGPNTRLRAGVLPCTELLLDLPDYVHPYRRRAASGFSDLSPAVKHQLGPVFGDFELAAAAGLGLPTGTTKIAGHGYGAYLQLPWSADVGDGWGIGGMVSSFWVPGQGSGNPTLEPTFVVERQVSERADAFFEYVADQPLLRGAFSHLLNSGAVFRPTPKQQLDFHVGWGLNRQAPAYFFGLGYSFRLDDVF